jgi:hypothetical protein
MIADLFNHRVMVPSAVLPFAALPLHLRHSHPLGFKCLVVIRCPRRFVKSARRAYALPNEERPIND